MGESRSVRGPGRNVDHPDTIGPLHGPGVNGRAPADGSLEALSDAGLRFARELREAGEPHRRMPRSEWSPVEAAVHVLQLLRIFARLAGGEGSPYTRHQEFPAISDDLIAAEPQRDPATLAGLIEDATGTWMAAAGERLPTDPFDWHGVVTITVADATGILLGEFLLHGRDIASAGGRPWDIAPRDARTILTSILPLLPFAVDEASAAGVRTRYGVHIRGLPPLRFAFEGAQLTIAPLDGPVDCHLAGDAVAVLLVAYGRWSHWQAIARGRLIAWGRRPLRALAFTSLLRNP